MEYVCIFIEIWLGIVLVKNDLTKKCVYSVRYIKYSVLKFEKFVKSMVRSIGKLLYSVIIISQNTLFWVGVKS